MTLRPLSVMEQIEAHYIAYYGRAGEPDGVSYWRSQLEAGRTFAEIAAAFSTQAESRTQHPFLAYPQTASPVEFVEGLYTQMLGRSSDPTGYAYWSEQLAAANGDPFRIGILIAQFISGANVENGDAATILNKIDAGEYFTSQLNGRGIGGTLNGTLLAHELRAISRDAVDNDITSDHSSVSINVTEIDTFLAKWSNGLYAIQRVSLGDDWQQFDDDTYSSQTSISADGRYVAITRAPRELTPNTQTFDVYIRDVVLGQTSPVITGLMAANAAPLSDDGSAVAIVNTTTSTTTQVYLSGIDSGMTLVSRSGTESGNGHSGLPDISGDGNVIGFQSTSTNFDPRDLNGRYDVFLGSRNGTPAVLISYGDAPADGHSINVSLSYDGSRAVFESTATNLIAGSSVANRQVYLWDQGNLTLVSRARDGAYGDANSANASISSDGNLIVYESGATNLVAQDSDQPSIIDIFLFNVQTDQTTLISVASDGGSANNASFFPDISGDGRYVVFASLASNLDGGQNGVNSQIFVRDLIRNETHLVSRPDPGLAGQPDQIGFGNASSFSASISEDGRFVTFYSRSTNLVNADTNDPSDVFIVDGFVQGWWW